ncbi:MAG: hypothetical protein CMQ30_05820 [Gammaproteobacteria bacterium]|nr:hypothetical protein [Gammaproteobacteria bacterium]
MKLIKPFRGVRPTKELASQVASPPYDVVSRSEARGIAKGNPYSFLHINKPDIDLDDDIDADHPLVYQTGRNNLDEFLNSGVLIKDEVESFYLYRQIMGRHEQLGLVAIASVDAYNNGSIKIHELTRPNKEADRVRHMEELGAQVGPVFMTYKENPALTNLMNEVAENDPEYNFIDESDVRHTFWTIQDRDRIASIEDTFEEVKTLYVADGHHRSAAASRVRERYRNENKDNNGRESYNYFLVVIFPHNQMKILDYNRVLKDLNGMSAGQFISAIETDFILEKVTSEDDAKPSRSLEFGLYLEDSWFRLTLKPEVASTIETSNPVDGLDVSVLQKYILSPILEIHDQRTDERIEFVGGIKGLLGLKDRVIRDGWMAGIALYPTSVESLMKVADAGEVMPPKSTWFEPKLKSGLVSHLLD